MPRRGKSKSQRRTAKRYAQLNRAVRATERRYGPMLPAPRLEPEERPQLINGNPPIKRSRREGGTE